MSNYLDTLTPARWLADTHVLVGVRGDRLQALDQAIAQYCTLRVNPAQRPAAAERVRKAFEGWVLHKMQQAGQGPWHPGMFLDARKNAVWQGDRRNQRGAMTRLYDSLYTESEVAAASAARRDNLRQAEREAIEYMQLCTEKLAAKLFAGKTCQFRLMASRPAPVITREVDPAAAPAEGAGAGLLERARAHVDASQDRWRARAELGADQAWRAGALVMRGERGAMALQGNPGGDPRIQSQVADWLRGLLRQMTPDTDAGAGNPVESFIALHGSLFDSVLATLMPVLGPVSSVLGGTRRMAAAALQVRAARGIDARPFARGTSAVAAIQAVTRLMRSQADRQAAAGMKQALLGAARLVADCIPGGQGASAGLGVLDALARLMAVYFEFLEDYHARNALNAVLANLQDPDTAGATRTRLDTGAALFEAHPLLGAYWVLIAETSSVIGLCADDFATGNFMEQVEQIARTHLAELRSAAADLVARHHLVIPELMAHRLVVQAQSATPHSTAWRRVADTIKDTVRSWTLYRRAARVFPQPSWRERLVGQSSEEYFAQQDAIAARTLPPGSRAEVHGLMDRLARR